MHPEQQRVLQQRELDLPRAQVQEVGKVGEARVESARAEAHQIIGRLLPQREDVDAAKGLALLEQPHLHAHHRRLNGCPEPDRTGAAHDHPGAVAQSDLVGAGTERLGELLDELFDAMRGCRLLCQHVDRVECGAAVRLGVDVASLAKLRIGRHRRTHLIGFHECSPRGLYIVGPGRSARRAVGAGHDDRHDEASTIVTFIDAD